MNRKSQIVMYIIFGMVIFLIFIGLINLVINILPYNKTISAQEVNQYINNCLNLGLTCGLYTYGMNSQHQNIDDTKTSITNYLTQALKHCLGDLSQKFKGNSFSFTDNKPNVIFSDETTSSTLNKLGTMKNGNVQKTLEGYNAQTPVAFTKIKAFAKQLLDTKNKIDTVNTRYHTSIYQLDTTKDAVIITDAQSRINGKEYKMIIIT